MKLTLLATTGTPNGIPAAVKATGSITTVAKANLLSGEKVVINDGRGMTLEFVFDLTGSAVTLSTNQRRVDFSADTSADNVRDRLITAINAAWELRVTASSGGAATVTLTNDFPGAQGNITVTETVVDAGFAVTGMSSGALSGFPLRGRECAEDASFHEDDRAMAGVKSTAGSGTMTATVAIWGYQADLQRWWRFKALNAGAAIAETSSDKIDYAELIEGLRHFDRVYGELVAVGGTTPSYEIHLFARSPKPGAY